MCIFKVDKNHIYMYFYSLSLFKVTLLPKVKDKYTHVLLCTTALLFSFPQVKLVLNSFNLTPFVRF